MDEHPQADAKCPRCHSSLAANGSCLVCLLRGGLPEETTVCAAAPAATPTVYGDFEVARREDGSLWELGRGAMGITYRAVDRVLHRPVALKVIQVGAMPVGSGGANAGLRERFLREARAAAALRHTNVAGVFQFGAPREAELCYYAMELVEGETLEARVRRAGPLEVGTTLEVAAQVAAALVAAAARGLIHRDLKPSNLMLAGTEGSTRPEVKVIDFGLAKAATAPDENDLTQGGFVGTPTFASPEQLRRLPTDARTDLYSLGVTLWYALTGRVPFAGQTLDELCQHPARTALPVEQLRARKVPPVFVNLLCAMLAADPARRPASAREFATALEACRRACAEGGRVPARGHFRARNVAFAFGAVLGLMLLGTGIASRATRPRSEAPVPTNHGSPAAPGPTVPEKSVAVLPFANLSADKDNAFFADGVQDEVLTDLAKVADLKVISRTSVMQYREPGRNLAEIGKNLGVAYVVEGSVQRTGNRIRVTAQLIDARTDVHRWAEKYDRDLADQFSVQSEIAQAIAGQLQATISPREQAALAELPTHDEGAYALYLRARSLWDAYDNIPDRRALCDSTLDLLRQATARDPNFVRALALMTLVQGTRFRNAEHTEPNATATRDLAETVARLRPGSTEAHMAMGCYHYLVTYDFARARDEFAAGVRGAPNDAWAHRYLAMSLRRLGLLEESLAALRPALELDPEARGNFVFYLEILHGLRRYAEAAAAIDRRLTDHPQLSHLWIWKAFLISLDWRADPHASLDDLSHLPAGFDPEGTTTFYRLESDAMSRDFDAMERDLAASPLATIYRVPRELFAGDVARYRGHAAAARAAYTVARQRLAAEVRLQPTYADLLFYLALVDASLGQRDEALAEGQRALANTPANDARDRPEAMVNWAKVLLRLGEREEVMDILQTLGRQPYGLEYGRLRLEPDWDPLRGDPRFTALVAFLAPKP